jgi:hypothetical protein
MQQRKERYNGVKRVRKRNKEVRDQGKDFTVILKLRFHL